MLLYDFLTTTMLLIQSFGSHTSFTTIFCSIISSIFFIMSYFTTPGICCPCCTGRMVLSTLVVVLQEGNQLCQRHLFILPIFFSLKVDSHLLFFLCLCHVSISSFTWSLLTFSMTKFSAILSDTTDNRGPFWNLSLETVIWS